MLHAPYLHGRLVSDKTTFLLMHYSLPFLEKECGTVFRVPVQVQVPGSSSSLGQILNYKNHWEADIFQTEQPNFLLKTSFKIKFSTSAKV